MFDKIQKQDPRLSAAQCKPDNTMKNNKIPNPRFSPPKKQQQQKNKQAGHPVNSLPRQSPKKERQKKHAKTKNQNNSR
jgi:hypothetical protein